MTEKWNRKNEARRKAEKKAARKARQPRKPRTPRDPGAREASRKRRRLSARKRAEQIAEILREPDIKIGYLISTRGLPLQRRHRNSPR